ncbi:MAG TPA: hypothetical protein VJK52_03870, partial [Candidatus Nanoarchaeia archaeon]|nr:hypothetical protein [Candidatus Nanoarchaeia archaeon]
DPGCIGVFDINEMLGTMCDDGRDNDFPPDSLIDMNDPGCQNVYDNSEVGGAGGEPECDDDIDNDHNGDIDLDDDGCWGSHDDTERSEEQCDNGVDDDHDSVYADYEGVDLNGDGDFNDIGELQPDPGCDSIDDNSELDPNVECDNGVDDPSDTDTAADFPNDWGCASPTDETELNDDPAFAFECDDGQNNDLDGLVDMEDPGCSDMNDPFETMGVQCDNGIDDADADIYADWPRDLGCESPSDTDENDGGTPTCEDGIKNQDETDVDCGGICDPCADGLQCGTGPNADENCQSELCNDGVCESCPDDGQGIAKSHGPAECGHCSDGIKTPGTDETDVDCGGSQCGPCNIGKICLNTPDCEGGACVQSGAVKRCTEAEHCNDGFQNYDEIALDCGGRDCKNCGHGSACATDGDCRSGKCQTDRDLDGFPTSSFCLGPAHCFDGVKTSGTDESGIDCGGNDCRGCAQGVTCNVNTDCEYHLCVPNAGGAGVNLCSKCVPLYPDHNNINPGNDRINLFFTGVNFPANGELFKQTVRNNVDLHTAANPTGQNPNGVGLAELPVYKDNLDKFNFWYFPILTAPNTDISRCDSEYCRCDAACNSLPWPISNPNNPNAYCTYVEPDANGIFLTRMCNWMCQSIANQVDNPPPRYVSHVSTRTDAPFSLVHEFQHLFAELGEEYYAPGSPSPPAARIPRQPNCAATRADAEQWWGDIVGLDAVENMEIGYYSECQQTAHFIKPTVSSLMDGRAHHDLGIAWHSDYRLGAVNRRCIQQRINLLTGGPVTNYACGFQ